MPQVLSAHVRSNVHHVYPLRSRKVLQTRHLKRTSLVCDLQIPKGCSDCEVKERECDGVPEFIDMILMGLVDSNTAGNEFHGDCHTGGENRSNV